MNVLVLGSSGKLGSFLSDYFLELGFNVFKDSDHSLAVVFTFDFFDLHNVTHVVNCAGSYSEPSYCFHSNFYFPLSVVAFLSRYCSFLDKRQLNSSISYIHFSSVSSFIPYQTGVLEPISLSLFERAKVLGTPYEMSKLYCDSFLLSSFPSNNRLRIHLFWLSVFVFDNKLPRTLSALLALLPFRFSTNRLLPVTTLHSIRQVLRRVMLDTTTSSHRNAVSSGLIVDRVPISSFYYPRLLFLLKPPINQRLLELIPSSAPFGLLSRLFRAIYFLGRL